MRELLTAIGILLCIALAALMAGPYFVDWGQYRPYVQQRLSEAVGATVIVEGPIAVTLLPTPSATLEQIRIGEPGERGLRPVEIERVTVSLAATSLLRGDIHVTEAAIEHPVLRVAAGASLTPPRAAAGSGVAVNPDQVSIERLLVRDGTMVFDRPGRTALTVSKFEAEVEANSILGPAKGNGSFVVNDDPRSFRFALGRLEGGKTRVKALIEDIQLAMRLDIDGDLAAPGSGSPIFEGTLAASGSPILGRKDNELHLPLRATARAALTSEKLDLADIAITLGGDPQPFTMTGSAELKLGATPRLDMAMAARSFDFDRMDKDGKANPIIPAELVRRAVGLAPEGETGERLDGSLDLTVGGVIAGGQTIIGARTVVTRDASGLSIALLEGELPGQTRIRFERGQNAGPGALNGRIDIEARDPERFMHWYFGAGHAPTAGLSLKAGATLSSLRDGLNLADIRIERGGTALTGEGSYMLPLAGRRPAPKITLKLASQQLNIADLPSFNLDRDRKQDGPELDFDLDLAAAKLEFEGKETGRLVAKVRRDGKLISIERLAVTDFGGSSVIASGTLGGGARRITVKVEADKADALAALGEKLLPGSLMHGVRERAGMIAPVLLVASFANEDQDDSYDIRAEGRLADTKVEAGGKLAGKGDLKLDIDISLQNPDGAHLAAQIVGRPAPEKAGGPGAISLSMRGNPRGSLSTLLTGAMPGIEARVTGVLKIFQPFSPFEGDVTIRAPDLGPAATALGVTVPAIPRGTAGALTGRVESNLERITIENLQADIGGQKFSGEIAFAIQDGGKVAGQIKTPRVDFRPVMALAMGAAKPGGAAWSTQTFGRPFAPPLAGDLWIEAGKARLDDRTELEDAKFVLRFAEGAASVEYGHFRLNQARIEGDVFLRRAGPNVALASKLKVGGLRLDRFAPGEARGEIEAEAQVSGSGDTPSRLVASLAGGGSLAVRGKTTPRFDPGAIARLLATPLEQIGPLDAANIGGKLEAELDKAPWIVPEARTSLVVVNGVARTGVAGFEAARGRFETNANFDLNAMALDYRVTATSSAAPADWRGALPQFSATWRGPLAAPKREVSVDSLVNGYLALALSRDLAKAEILDQDIRERAMHNRRLRAEEARRRAAEEMRRAEEVARLQEIERQKREQAAAEERLRNERMAEEERQRRERAAEAERQRQARLQEEERLRRERAAEEERLRAARAAEEERQRQERAAEAERQRQARLQEEERLRAERLVDEQRQREARAEEDRQREANIEEGDSQRVDRIRRILQQNENAVPPPAPAPPAAISPPAAPRAARPVAPPMNINPVAPSPPRVAAPVEVRPLAPPPTQGAPSFDPAR